MNNKNIEEQIKEKYLFKKIGSIGQKTFLIRSCPDQMRDGYEYVGDITKLLQASNEQYLDEFKVRLLAEWVKTNGFEYGSRNIGEFIEQFKKESVL